MVQAAGATQLGLTVAASAGVAAAIAYTAYSYQPSGTLTSVWNKCNWPHGNDPSNRYGIIDSSLCLALPLYRLTRSDLVSIGAFSLAASGIMPLAAHLTYTAISPNARLGFLSAALPAFIAVSHFIGAGALAAGPIVVLYAAGSLLFFSTRASLVPLPTRALGAHLLNLLLSIYFFAALGVMLLNHVTPSPKWDKAVLALLLVPLALVNLPTITAGFRVPQTEVDVRKALALFSAGELSSAFERTWSSYRRVGLASAILYWYGIGRIANGLLFEPGTPLNDASLHALLTFAGTSTALYALLSIDRLTTRPRTSHVETTPLQAHELPKDTKPLVARLGTQTVLPHPLTGQDPPALTLERDRALARAPAGHPLVELGWRGTALASLLGGPGLAACFWWARGEEEAGWRARREWRAIQALGGKKE